MVRTTTKASRRWLRSKSDSVAGAMKLSGLLARADLPGLVLEPGLGDQVVGVEQVAARRDR